MARSLWRGHWSAKLVGVSSILTRAFPVLVAQTEEQEISNLQVGGSIPSGDAGSCPRSSDGRAVAYEATGRGFNSLRGRFCSRGEMDITLRYGRSIEGSNPSENALVW